MVMTFLTHTVIVALQHEHHVVMVWRVRAGESMRIKLEKAIFIWMQINKSNSSGATRGA